MKLKARIWMIIVAALIGLVTISGIALYTLKQQLVEEKQVQIKTLLDMSVSVAKYYHEQEKAGSLRVCEDFREMLLV